MNEDTREDTPFIILLDRERYPLLQQGDIGIELEAGVSDCGKRYGGLPFIRFFVYPNGVWFTLCKLVKVPTQVVDYGFGPVDFEADSV